MLGLAKREARALWRGIAALDKQTLTVLLLASILGMWKYTFGGTTYFAEEIAPIVIPGRRGRLLAIYSLIHGQRDSVSF